MNHFDVVQQVGFGVGGVAAVFTKEVFDFGVNRFHMSEMKAKLELLDYLLNFCTLHFPTFSQILTE